jgi:S-formylglutathione hydrolase FrmB
MSSGQLTPSIIVMPSDGGYGQGTFYMDWYDGTGNFEQYFLYDLVIDIDKNYRTLKDTSKRVVCGLSMGGFGAFSLALRNPGLFGAAASLSGWLISTRHLSDQFSRSEVSRLVGPLYGPHAQAHDLQLVARSILTSELRPALYLNCGQGDYLFAMNEDFHHHLDQIGYEHTYEEFEGGHTWDYWKEHLPDALKFFQAYFRSC